MSKDQSRSFQKFEALDCFVQVRQMIIDGFSAPEIAEYIQESCLEALDWSLAYLVNVIRNYRTKAIPVGTIMQRHFPGEKNKIIAKTRDAVREIDELEKLHHIQRLRIGMAFERERETGFLLKTTGNEISIDIDILKNLSEIKLKTGTSSHRALPYEINMSGVPLDSKATYGTETIGRVLAEPEKRQRIFRFVELIAKSASQKNPEVKNQFDLVEKSLETRKALPLVLAKAKRDKHGD